MTMRKSHKELRRENTFLVRESTASFEVDSTRDDVKELCALEILKICEGLSDVLTAIGVSGDNYTRHILLFHLQNVIKSDFFPRNPRAISRKVMEGS